jgi:hypothetical protein
MRLLDRFQKEQKSRVQSFGLFYRLIFIPLKVEGGSVRCMMAEMLWKRKNKFDNRK